MMKIIILFNFLTTSLFLFVLCSHSFAQKIETVDGVKIIHNDKSKWGKKPKVELELIKKIGDPETDDENYQLYRPVDVVKDVEGNIYILEMGNYCIKKYTPEGKYISTIGQKGKGPGELEIPAAFAINEKSQIYVLDPGNNRLQKFSSNGDDLGSIRTSIEKRPMNLCFLKTGELLVNTMVMPVPGQNPDDLKEKPALLYKMDAKGNYHHGFGTPHEYKNFQMAMSGNNILFATDANDNIYATFMFQNRIEKYTSEGTLLFRTDRPLKYKVSHKMVKRTFNVQGRSREMDVPEMVIVSGGISIDYKNRIWVITITKQPEWNNENPNQIVRPSIEFEIFDNDGILLGTLPFTEVKGQVRIFGDKLYIIEPQEEMCVYEYRIVEK